MPWRGANVPATGVLLQPPCRPIIPAVPMGKQSKPVKLQAEPKRRHNGKSPPDQADVRATKASKPKPLCLDKKFQKVDKKPKLTKPSAPKDGKDKDKVENQDKNASRPPALRKPASASTSKEAKVDQGKGKKALDDLKEKLEKMKALEQEEATEEEGSDGGNSEALDAELEKLLDWKPTKVPKDMDEDDDGNEEDESGSDDASEVGSGDDNEGDDSSDSGEGSEMEEKMEENEEDASTTAEEPKAVSNALVPHESNGQRNSNLFCK